MNNRLYLKYLTTFSFNGNDAEHTKMYFVLIYYYLIIKRVHVPKHKQLFPIHSVRIFLLLESPNNSNKDDEIHSEIHYPGAQVIQSVQVKTVAESLT